MSIRWQYIYICRSVSASIDEEYLSLHILIYGIHTFRDMFMKRRGCRPFSTSSCCFLFLLLARVQRERKRSERIKEEVKREREMMKRTSEERRGDRHRKANLREFLPLLITPKGQVERRQTSSPLKSLVIFSPFLQICFFCVFLVFSASLPRRRLRSVKRKRERR